MPGFGVFLDRGGTFWTILDHFDNKKVIKIHHVFHHTLKQRFISKILQTCNQNRHFLSRFATLRKNVDLEQTLVFTVDSHILAP